jgi:hypothetical protein
VCVSHTISSMCIVCRDHQIVFIMCEVYMLEHLEVIGKKKKVLMKIL